LARIDTVSHFEALFKSVTGGDSMTDQAQQFYVAETAEGQFVAYTTRSPYFCFVEGSEADAVSIGNRAFDLSEQIELGDFHQKSVTRTVTELTPTRVVHRKQLALAGD
jgi:hypothetical protein